MADIMIRVPQATRDALTPALHEHSASAKILVAALLLSVDSMDFYNGRAQRLGTPARLTIHITPEVQAAADRIGVSVSALLRAAAMRVQIELETDGGN